LILSVYIDLVALQLALGSPLTREVFERAIDGALLVTSVVTGLL
jgi:hypothetical protein